MPLIATTRITLFCLAVVLAPAGAARAATLCARDEVAQVVAEEMRGRNHYARLDRRSVLEWATDDPNTVRCTAVGVVEAPYASAGTSGAYCEVYRYSVTVAARRFSVRFVD